VGTVPLDVADPAIWDTAAREALPSLCLDLPCLSKSTQTLQVARGLE